MSECCVVDGGGDSVCVCCMVFVYTGMCTVGVYKCVCVCPMCVLSVAISNSVSCVVCGIEVLFYCAQCTCVCFCCVVLL